MTTASPPGERVGWASLPNDLLTCVCELLSVPGRICFRAVCRSWRAADVVQDQRPVAMPPPWVVSPRVIKGFSDSFTLLSVPTMQAFRWTPPGGRWLRCVGSSGGWLAGVFVDVDGRIRISLLNPLTDACVEVPASLGRVSSMPDDRSESDEFWLPDFVQKVAFSPSPSAQDFAVAVVTSRSTAVAFARARSEGWCAFAELPDVGRGSRSVDAELDVAYHGGRFYYMSMYGHVWVVDMAAPYPSTTLLAYFPPPVPGLVHRRRGYHLAVTGDGAVHVVWSRSSDDGASWESGLDMLARRYDPTRRARGLSPWAPATRLRGHAFLIGDRNQTLSVPVDGDGAWLRPDSVYFANIGLGRLLAVSRERRLGPRGVWVLDLATGDIVRPTGSNDESAARESSYLYRPNRLLREFDWARSLWLMPSLR
ncbi:hypothetical protein ACP70R_030343 [Stipagrostis hirtigluma subsp. patula]